jgi:hypothetical protein
VQLFVALGKVLKETYGYCVRLATHKTFKDFVIENSLELFCIGCDPVELIAFIVKNSSLMPSCNTLRSSNISKQRKSISKILRRTMRFCIKTSNSRRYDYYSASL